MGVISVSLPSDGTTADVSDYNTPITTIVNAINGNLDSSNISSLSGTKITAGTLSGSALDSTTAGGYITGLAAPNTVTYNGNRSYSLVFNSTNLTTTLSPGMRLRTTRSVAAPTQCTSLNGSTQFYSKTSPTGMTGTTGYSYIGWIKPTAYQTGIIESKFSSSGTNNGWNFYMNASGQLVVVGWNANNNRTWTTYQSVALNKWSSVTARLDMTSTATSGVITIDGVDVPVTYSTIGSPTTWVNAGNLEIGSNNGGTNLFAGKLAQVAVFNALISQATLLTYISQGLLGTETSLISAYSFNNSINDLNANANNLTANGSAVATNADSPFGGQAGGTISSTLDYGVITSATFSTNTTLTVQVPEGCTIPTSGGVSAVSYSTQLSPYGFPGISKFKLSAFDTGGTLTTPLLTAMVLYVIDKPLEGISISNTGTSGGTMVLSVSGSEKRLLFQNASATATTTYTVVFPTGFLSTLQGITVGATGSAGTTTGLYIVTGTQSSTGFQYYSGTNPATASSFQVVGT